MVLDATCLSHFARAGRLDFLRDLLVGRRCWTTAIVLAELNRGLVDYPMLRHVPEQEWLPIAARWMLDGSTPLFAPFSPSTADCA
jgi:hypothetical protein